MIRAAEAVVARARVRRPITRTPCLRRVHLSAPSFLRPRHRVRPAGGPSLLDGCQLSARRSELSAVVTRKGHTPLPPKGFEYIVADAEDGLLFHCNPLAALGNYANAGGYGSLGEANAFIEVAVCVYEGGKVRPHVFLCTSHPVAENGEVLASYGNTKKCMKTLARDAAAAENALKTYRQQAAAAIRGS